MDKWIKVEDQLPEKDTEVWVFDTEFGQISAEYTGHEVYQWQDSREARPMYHVTHWMPLPEDPE